MSYNLKQRVVPTMILVLQFITWNLIYYCIDFGDSTKALFRCEKILNFTTVAFSFIYGKYCLIMD